MARDVQQENIYERKTKVGIIFETDLEYRTSIISDESVEIFVAGEEE